MAISVFKRCEEKYLINENEYRVLLMELLKYMDYDTYCLNEKTYRVINIYYDTVDNNLIRMSTNKPVYKEKLRLRRYDAENDTCFLEIKKKCIDIVSKRRVIVTVDEALKYLETGEKPNSDNYIQKQVFNELDYFLKVNRVYPKVMITYDRLALFDKENHNLRVTFDKNILTRRENIGINKEIYGRNILPSKTYLMEVKIDGTIPVWLADLLNYYGIYPTSFSKYGREYRQNVKELYDCA